MGELDRVRIAKIEGIHLRIKLDLQIFAIIKNLTKPVFETPLVIFLFSPFSR